MTSDELNTLAPPIFPERPQTVVVYGEDGHRKEFIVAFSKGKFTMEEQHHAIIGVWWLLGFAVVGIYLWYRIIKWLV